MIKTKKQMFIVIGAFALILLLGTASYAFFNYTRTGGTNRVGIGRIYFNTDQGNDTLTLTNIFPMTSTQATTANLDSVAVHIEGDTTYDDGEEFEITLVNVTNTVNGKTIPINYTATYTATTNKGIGTESSSYSDYFTDRGSSSSKYTLEETGEVSEGKQVLVGYIPKNGEVDGTLTIKAYIDSSKVVISDTLAGGAIEVTGYNNGYPNPGEGVTVLTTAEWNALEGAGSLKFSIRGIANEGTWVPDPNGYLANIKCQRVTDATKLHTETCTNSRTTKNCRADGYSLNGLITYGNAKGLGSTLAVGDAFDCDINGDGKVNEDTNGNSTERFYYVSEYYNTDTLAFDNSTGYATLIYYSNTVSGAISTGRAEYASTADIQAIDSNAAWYDNWHGPVTAVNHLPTTSQWSNITLKTTSRAILAEDGSTHNATTTGNGANTLPTAFSYSGRAARLLTAQELMRGCGLTQVGSETTGELSNCNFLFEGTNYADSTGETYGPWLETPIASESEMVWYADTEYRCVYEDVSSGAYISYGVRPAIDVPYSLMAY